MNLAILALTVGACQPVQVQHVVQQQVFPQQYYVPQVYYFVGAPIRLQALEKKEEEQEVKAEGLVKQYCGNCHARANQENGLFQLTGLDPITAEVGFKAIKMISFDEMPKGKKLTKEEKNALLQELFSLQGDE